MNDTCISLLCFEGILQSSVCTHGPCVMNEVLRQCGMEENGIQYQDCEYLDFREPIVHSEPEVNLPQPSGERSRLLLLTLPLPPLPHL